MLYPPRNNQIAISEFNNLLLDDRNEEELEDGELDADEIEAAAQAIDEKAEQEQQTGFVKVFL